MKNEKIIVWFRNDLRVHDQEALFRASQKAAEVIGVYCFDYHHFDTTELGLPKTGAHRARFLLESVADLKQHLQQLGSDLVIRVGRPEAEVAKLAVETGATAIYASKEVTSEEEYVEERLEKNAWKAGIATTFFWQSTLYHLDDLPMPIHALPDIFTQFRKQTEKFAPLRETFPVPSRLGKPTVKEWGKLPSMDELGLKEPIKDERAVLDFKGGETAGKQRLHAYFWQEDCLKSYKETRNGLIGANYSSKFSPWLAHGCLSPRFIYEEVKQYERQRKKNSSTYWLIFELIWRDYFRFVAKKYGKRIFFKRGIKNESIPMQGKKAQFNKWRNAKTGIPFIDANMLELKHTGFMSNRGRQNVASFLVKDLKCDWRWGASYFESTLIDYDPCSNWCNWNYVAGIGNDPRENRYFNILSQAERYDPKGEFVKHWLPQLQELPSGLVHRVGDLYRKEQADYGVTIGADYPHPMVSLKRWD